MVKRINAAKVIRMNKKRGMTLIEIVVSVLVLGLCLVPVFDLLRKSGTVTKAGQDEVIASNLAAEIVDQISCMPFKDIPDLAEREFGNADNEALLMGGKISTILILSDLPAGYKRFLKIETISSRLKKVSTKVKWGTNPVHEIKMPILIEWKY
ncbi:MAG: prepilin-type N-terminal cleavage/methylation domain-containing protein [Candidatus Riflebacteria bacterium]|nr:prepilin-type N-terminal cleavage/methylation domain-containing protein [Candidatus Riflebacteria bacterium]